MSAGPAVPDYTRLRVSCVGDLIADHYLVTEPRSLSREAPVMVLRYSGEEYRAGGVANVARNARDAGRCHSRGPSQTGCFASSCCSSPVWYISFRMSQPPMNSPFR